MRIKLLILLVIFCVSETAAAKPDFPQVIESTVRVVAVMDKGYGTGTGFIVTSNGYIVTNEHVVDGARELVVLRAANNIPIPATLVAADKGLDLAILKIAVPGSLPPLPFGIEDPDVGGDVWAIGFPGQADRLGGSVEPTITRGILSKSFIGSWNRRQDVDLMQHSAQINPGNSGGPLLNSAGCVIGVNTQGAGSKVVTDTTGRVIDVQAGTEIFFSSDIDEALRFLRAQGVTVRTDAAICAPPSAGTPSSTAEVEALRRALDKLQEELDSLRSASGTGPPPPGTIAAIEDQLEATRQALAAAGDGGSASSNKAAGLALLIAGLSALLSIFVFFREPRRRAVQVMEALSQRVRPQSDPLQSVDSKKPVTVPIRLSAEVDGQRFEKNTALNKSERSGFVVGRGPELSHMKLDHVTISKRHLRLRHRSESEFTVEDLNSLSGTICEGTTLKPFTRKHMPFGSTIRCGAATLRVDRR